MKKYEKKLENLKFHVRENKEFAAIALANDISRILKEFHDDGAKEVLFLTSGGSAFTVLDRISDEVIGPYLTIGMLDERYDPENKLTNYAQLRKTTFYKKAVQRGCRLIDTSTKKGQTQNELAQSIETELRDWKTTHPRGVVMVTLGIGPDGHTAGIMPFPENVKKFHELFEGDRWVVGYDAAEKNPIRLRVSATCTFLRTMVDFTRVFVVGKEKGEIFAKVCTNNDLATYPGSIIRLLSHGSVYVDTPVADALKQLNIPK